MTTGSFKQDAGHRPSGYRTPSPPRFAIESLSPLFADGSTTENGGMRWPSKRSYHRSITGTSDTLQSHVNETERNEVEDSQGAMDAFASIALATSSDIAPRRSSQQEQACTRSGMVFAPSNDQLERPAKRARSEKLPSPQPRRKRVDTRMRPATSYGQSSDSRMLEAELLLNFAQEARFSVPPQSDRQEDREAISSKLIASPIIHSGLPLQQSNEEEEQKGNMAHLSKDYNHTRKDGQSAMRLSDEASGEPEQSTCGQALQPASQPTSPRMHGALMQDGLSRLEQHAGDAPEEQDNTKSIIHTATQEIGCCPEEELRPNQPILVQKEKEGEIVQDEANSKHRAQDLVVSQPSDLVETTLYSSEHVQIQSPPHTEPNDATINLLPDNTSAQLDSLSMGIHVDNTTTAPRADSVSKAVDTDSVANTSDMAAPAVCAGCGFTRNIVNGEIDPSPTSWISCDACKSWFHFACAGFKNEREVRSVDKYRCRKCKPIHGPTTYVRKSSRAHSSIDYAGLHQGVIKTSDDTPEHHYIKPIKEGTISFLPETFARMRPELVTAEYFEHCHGWKEPIVVPAAFNPQPRDGSPAWKPTALDSKQEPSSDAVFEGSAPEEWAFDGSESQYAPDHGQDALDMVMPQGLTVRTVAELYGPEEKVEVIDVKSQNGEGKKWNMRRWADYYESKGNKIVRNVISLEVSQSKLGRLIRRPQIVRDLDLQDAVWPAELQAKGEIPRVQFYCLMSVADCFTDFHIDFGGSSVFYHILKGKKTFFFIPPKEKHLKKYEEWCLSPAQNWTFLGDQTKECYRVDLSEGDTMLIPAGWIHAVWTPEDSLVIGGNFLTRLNYGMQLRIAQIEKATGVARKFRYPHFQKIHWYTAFRYLEEDPLPATVKDLLQGGGIFHRQSPSYHDFNDWGENSKSGPENYHGRYYSQAELEGLPDLVRYLLRTALIDTGSITDGITAETRNAVKRSIPRGHGEPLDVVKNLAAWCAWKRGNETIPSWAYPDVVPEPESAGKVSMATQKKLDREAALQAPRRQSARMRSQQQSSSSAIAQVKGESKDLITEHLAVDAGDKNCPQSPTKREVSDLNLSEPTDMQILTTPKRRRTMSGTGLTSHRKVACESCRKRRRACKHKDTKNVLYPDSQISSAEADGVASMLPLPYSLLTNGFGNSVGAVEATRENVGGGESKTMERIDPSITMQQLNDLSPNATALADTGSEQLDLDMDYLLKHPDEIASTPKMLTHLSGAGLLRLEHRIAGGPVNGLSVLSLNAPHSRGRTKACNDCRKSKRRCIHDEHGNEDPVKARESAIPRPAAAHKRRKLNSEGNETVLAKKARKSTGSMAQDLVQQPSSDTDLNPQTTQMAPVANMLTASSSCEMQQHTQQKMLSAFEQMQAAATAATERRDGMNTSDHNSYQSEGIRADENPPAPAARSNTALAEPDPDIPPEVPASHPIASTPPDSKENIPLDPALVASSQPAASLVSPPASEHPELHDTSNTPPSPSTTSSRHSSHRPNQQHYTPESGSRRASSSPIDEAPEPSENARASSGPTIAGKEVSPMTTISTTGEDDRKEMGLGMADKRKSRGSMEGIADEESLKLIKELQAEEYGLRRRGRV